jgi:hypothetical protein
MDRFYPDNVIVPEADAICQAIFAGTVALGRPDPFLARELADGTMHFVSLEGDFTSNDAVRESVVKIVRELGHPRLAQVIDCGPVANTWAGYWTSANDPASNEIFPSNLVAAHDSGLITLCDRDLSDKMVGGLLERPRHRVGAIDWTRRSFEARQWLGRYVVLDGAEYYLGASTPEQWLHDLAIGLHATQLRAIVNLNTGPNDNDEKSLFSPRQPSFWEGDELQPAWDILSSGIASTDWPQTTQWRWHLSDRDFEPDRRGVLTRLCELPDSRISVVFDRPRCVTCLGDGIDRRTLTIAQRVDLSLSALQNYLPAGVDCRSFIDKCGSLIRLALTAGHAKQMHLRARGVPEVRASFHIERSATLMTVCDWNGTANHFFPDSDVTDDSRTAFEDALHQRLAGVVTADEGQNVRLTFPERGVYFFDPQSSLEKQLETVAGGRFDEVRVKLSKNAPEGDRLVSLLQFLWRSTSVSRVQFCTN